MSRVGEAASDLLLNSPHRYSTRAKGFARVKRGDGNMPQTVRDRPERLVLRQKIEPRYGFGTVFHWLRALILMWGLSGILIAPLFAQAPPVGDVNPNPVEQTVAPLLDEKPIQTKNLLGVLRDGGPMMLPIAAC